MGEVKPEDERLLEALKKAAADEVDPSRAEATVGQPALLHTLRGSGRDALRVADIGPDPRCQDALPHLPDMQDVVYWRRPGNDDEGDVKIAGLLWHDDGRVEMFCGIVYPP